MSRYYVKMETLSLSGDETITSSNKMEENISMIKKSVNSMEWEGTAAENYTNLINQKIKKVEELSKLYGVFGKFMKSTSNGFTDVSDNIKKGFVGLNNENTVSGGTNLSQITENMQICQKCGSIMIDSICPKCGFTSVIGKI